MTTNKFHLMLAISGAMLLSSVGHNANAQSSSGASSAEKSLFSLDNTVFGGSQTVRYYPFSLTSWPCTSIDDVVYIDSEQNLISAKTRKKIASYSLLRKICDGWCDVIEFENLDRVWLSDGANFLLVSINDQSIIKKLDGYYDELAKAPGKDYVAFTDGRDLYVSSAEGKNRVNSESVDGIRYGSTVHRSEFGITGGMFWNPEGNRLCFYRKDETMVANYPLVDVTQRCATVVNTRYPMAGETSEQVSIGIYDVVAKKSIYLKTASPVDRYFTNISWSPDGKYVTVAEINRDQDHMWFCVYDSHTGEQVSTLFEETDAHWVEPDTPPLWLDDNRFVWISRRDNYRHLYLYECSIDKKTASVKQLTKGDWCVTSLLGYDDASRRILMVTNREGYLQRDVCALSLDGAIARLSNEGSFSEASYYNPGKRGFSHSMIVVNSSKPDLAKESYVVNVRNGKQVASVRRTVNPYEGFAMPKVETVNLMSADGKFPLTGRIVLPPDFDSSKKYPVIVYVYGGPHSQLVDGSWLWGADPWMLYFAQEGYIIFTMDNRGTEMRSNEFEQAIHRRLGTCESADQMVGYEYLCKLPYVDSQRIGVYGWSFGGFMTMTLLTRYPEAFKAGVAGGPVCDWQYYEVMYGERYMDTPNQNPGGYADASLLNRIKSLDANLLVIHDGMDSTVVWQHTQQLLNSAIQKGIFIDYAVYPNHEHNVHGADRVHLVGRILRYFDTWLKRD